MLVRNVSVLLPNLNETNGSVCQNVSWQVSVWEGDLTTWGYFGAVTYDGSKARRELSVAAIEHGSAEVMIVAYPTFQVRSFLSTGEFNVLAAFHYC
jgi:hypothetical protein